MISVIVILYVSSKNITYGILLGVIFMMTLFIYNKKRFEHIGNREGGDGGYKDVREVAHAAVLEFDGEEEGQLAYDIIVETANTVPEAIKILEELHNTEEWRDGGDEEDVDYENVREVADAAFQEFDGEEEGQLAYDIIVDKATDVTDAKKILKRLHEEGFPDEDEEGEEDRVISTRGIQQQNLVPRRAAPVTATTLGAAPPRSTAPVTARPTATTRVTQQQKPTTQFKKWHWIDTLKPLERDLVLALGRDASPRLSAAAADAVYKAKDKYGWDQGISKADTNARVTAYNNMYWRDGSKVTATNSRKARDAMF